MERAILGSRDRATSIDASESGDGAIEFSVAPRHLSSAEWSQLLSRAHLPVDGRTRPDGASRFESAEEREFYSRQAVDALGAVTAFIEPQRQIGTMVAGGAADAADELGHQRVDFALESPRGTRVVIEIDGEQHQYSPQLEIDRRRDAALGRAGWATVRIPTAFLKGEAIQELDASLELIASAVRDDRYLAACEAEAQRPCWGTPEGRAAREFVLTPHGVTRVQLGLLLAFGRGALRFDRPIWRITVVERDVACAHLAVVDLVELLGHLCALYDVPFTSRIELRVLQDHAFPQGAPNLSPFPADARARVTTTVARWRERIPPRACDVFLDVGVLAHPTASYGDDVAIRAAASAAGWFAVLRTAHSRAGSHLPSFGAPRAMTAPEDHADSLTYFLQYLFRKRAFRDGQLAIIARALRRQSVIGLLPTGAGKSIAYQLPALLSPGFALVVDPLKSLIQDQIDNLELLGIDAAVAIHSDLSKREQDAQVARLERGGPRFALIAPERLQIRDFRNLLAGITVARPVSFVVVDEVHCVSEWGHDFRPSYLNLGRLGRDLCRYDGTEPPFISLTGTASRSVLADVQREIDVLDPEAAIIPDTFDRQEIHFVIERTPSASKANVLVGLLQRLPQDLGIPPERFFQPHTAGIVFCRHANGQYGVGQIQATIQRHFAGQAVEVRTFAGTQPRGFAGGAEQWGRAKVQTQRDFKANRFPLLVATHAFGMGIDKPSIRYTVHYGVPPSLEAFYQEAGRAGRDRERAICAVIFSDDDAAAAGQFLDTSKSAEVAHERAKRLNRAETGDAGRLMFFLRNSFKGAQVEFAATRDLYRRYIRACWDERQLRRGEQAKVTIPWPAGESAKNDGERPLYRLLLLGLIADYTVDYAHRQFEATCRMLDADGVRENLNAYVQRYRNQDFAKALAAHLEEAASQFSDPIEHCIEALTWFVYEAIEKNRRAALRNIVDAMREARDGEDLRQTLLAYLEETFFTGQLKALMERVEPADWWNLCGQVDGPYQAQQLLGQCRRLLESDPDHPGLHILAGIARATLPAPNATTAADEFWEGIESLRANYRWEPERRGKAIRDLVRTLHQVAPSAFEPVTIAFLRQSGGDAFARDEYKRAAHRHLCDPALRRQCAMPMLRSIRSLLEG